MTAAGCATVRPVAENALYRSGQLSPEELAAAIDEYKIQTVVNLRGFQPHQPWYRAEREVCEQKRVRMIDLTLQSSEPDREEVIQLLETFETAPKPLLVHSNRSWGRSGSAAGIYRMAILNEDATAARRELAPWQRSWMPISTFRGPDQFLTEWSGEREFFEQYQIPPETEPPLFTVVGAYVAREEADAAAKTKVSKPAEEPGNPLGKFTLDRIGVDARFFSNDARSTYEFQGRRFPHQGRVMTDYRAVIVEGPVSEGPVLVGRGYPPRRVVAKKPASTKPATEREATAAAGKGPAALPPLGQPAIVMPSLGPAEELERAPTK